MSRVSPWSSSRSRSRSPRAATPPTPHRRPTPGLPVTHRARTPRRPARCAASTWWTTSRRAATATRPGSPPAPPSRALPRGNPCLLDLAPADPHRGPPRDPEPDRLPRRARPRLGRRESADDPGRRRGAGHRADPGDAVSALPPSDGRRRERSIVMCCAASPRSTARRSASRPGDHRPRPPPRSRPPRSHRRSRPTTTSTTGATSPRSPAPTATPLGRTRRTSGRFDMMKIYAGGVDFSAASLRLPVPPYPAEIYA